MEPLSQEVVVPDKVISKIKINVEMTVIIGSYRKPSALSGTPLEAIVWARISSCLGRVKPTVALLTFLGGSLPQEGQLRTQAHFFLSPSLLFFLPLFLFPFSFLLLFFFSFSYLSLPPTYPPCLPRSLPPPNNHLLLTGLRRWFLLGVPHKVAIR